ncbi:MAG: hypothetical protein U1E15_13565 [Hyphomicrobiales bacterium]
MKIEHKDLPAGNEKSAVWSKIGNIFSTHPGTEERIKEIQPCSLALPPGCP